MEANKINLPLLSDRLTGEKFQAWKLYIKSRLEMAGLDDHITPGASSPTVTNTGYDAATVLALTAKCQQADRQVKGLLKVNADHAVLLRIPDEDLTGANARQLLAKPVLNNREMTHTISRWAEERGMTWERLLSRVEDDYRFLEASTKDDVHALGTTNAMAAKIEALQAEMERLKVRAKYLCTNCKKTGHTLERCCAPGGGKAGQGPQTAKQGQRPSVAQANTATSAMGISDFSYLAAYRDSSKTIWLADSGCTRSIARNRTALSNPRPAPRFLIRAAEDGTTIKVNETGSLDLRLSSGGHARVHNVLHAPSASANLLSMNDLCKQGWSVRLDQHGGRITRESACIPLLRQDGQWVVDDLQDHDVKALATAFKTSIDCWHQRLGHASEGAIRKAIDSITGINLSDPSVHLRSCEVCLEHKLTRRPFSPKTARDSAGEILGLVHSDLADPRATGRWQHQVLHDVH